jgi:phenylalanyl-tRNA synthetase beta chain
MAIINISKKLFEKEIGILNEKMKEKIALFGTPLEKVDEEEIELEIFPNRPDMLSYQGFKRAFLGFLGKKKGKKSYKINKPEKNYIVNVDSSVKSIRPYTACAIVKKVKFNDEKIKEIIEIQEKLHSTIGRKRKKIAIGIYPLEKIKLPITLKALEPDKIKFIPLESEKEMSGLEILQKHPTGREYAHLLAGKEKFPIFIDSDKNILSMPPIINSKLTGRITEKTKEVFIECSGFDFELLKKCLNILVTSLADMGGKIYSMQITGNIKTRTPDMVSEKMKISTENVKKRLGIELNEKQIKSLIEKMGYNYDKSSKIVEIPAWRVDILHEVDLIEDIAIAYGYENFIPEIPKISTIGEEDYKERIKRKISEILSGLEMIEVSNYHLTTKNEQFQKMGLQEKDYIEVEKSKTDYTILRKDLVHYMLKVFSKNTNTEYPQRIFEIGKIFEFESEIKEKERLAIAVSPGDFTEIKQILEYLFRVTDKPVEISETENFPDYFVNGRVAEVKVMNKKIGFIGEIHPRILKNWKIKMPVAILEIELENFFKE